MDYLTYKKEQWPLRVSYYALKMYQFETGKGIETLEDELTNLEILLFYALEAGCKAEDKQLTLKREDMELVLDESLTQFTDILTGSFPDKVPGATSKGKKK